MNSNRNKTLILCCLLLSLSYIEARAANMGPQLLPLPAMAQVGPVMSQEAPSQPILGRGEVQWIQPNISLVADKGSSDQFDLSKAPIQRNIEVDLNIVKKTKTDPVPETDSILLTSEVQKNLTGGSNVWFRETIPTIPVPVTTPASPGTKFPKSGSKKINISFHTTMVVIVSLTGFMVNLASKNVY